MDSETKLYKGYGRKILGQENKNMVDESTRTKVRCEPDGITRSPSYH